MRRVALIVPSFPKLSETFVASKAHGLLERGWDLHVVCGSSDPAEWARFPDLARDADLRRRVHVARPHRPRWLAAMLTPLALLLTVLANPRGAARYLRRGWRRFGIDVVRRFYLDAELIALGPDLVHFEFGALAADRMYLKELIGCAVVVSFRGYDMHIVGLERPDYYQEVWERADSLHLLSESLWERARSRGCSTDMSHVLIPPAIDASMFDSPERTHAEVVGTSQRPLRIVSTGRLEWQKGYEYGLQAVKLLVERHLHCEYRVIGDGKYLESLAFARHQLGLDQVVALEGAFQRAKVIEQLAWADVFLHSAVTEGFCNAVVEAQSMRLPVVCSDAGGLPENVLDGVTGFVVPRRDPAALAEKLALLARDPRLRQRMGDAGRARVEHGFRLADQIAAFERLYRDVLEMPASGAGRSGATLDLPLVLTPRIDGDESAG